MATYIIPWKNPAVDPQKVSSITIPVAALKLPGTPGNNSDLTLTGKGAANYGQVQQQNLLRLLENFADFTPPPYPTVGQLWYDAAQNTIKVCTTTVPSPAWRALTGVNVSTTPPSPAALGDAWFYPTGTSTGVLYVYTGIGRFGAANEITIGGWDQVWPTTSVLGGREEYDELRLSVEQLAGSATGAYGSGAIGTLITNLTNFGELDRDLRLKWVALGQDDEALIGTASPDFIVNQALHQTAVVFNDFSSTNDHWVCGSANLSTAPVTIYLNSASSVTSHSFPASPLLTGLLLDDAYIMYSQSAPPAPGRTLLAVRYHEGVWQYDSSTEAVIGTWTNFTPASTHFIIGRISNFKSDVDNVRPGGKSAVIWAHGISLTGAQLQHLKIEPTSQDWDKLLAALRYAISRLDVPPATLKAVSDLPFVRDGAQAPATLLALPTSDVRYPSARRRGNRWPGLRSLLVAYDETINAINLAQNNRFSLRGISGLNGTYSSFPSYVQVTPHTTIVQSFSSGGGTVTLNFNFDSFNQYARFLFSGGAVQLAIAHAGSAAGDVAFQTLLSDCSTLRFTADRTRVFGASMPLTLTQLPIGVGLWNATSASDGGTVLFNKAAGSFITIKAIRVFDPTTYVDGTAAPYFALSIAFNIGQPLTGDTTFTFSIIQDSTGA